MKILRVLGIVAAAHAVAIIILFAIQGCSSTTKSVPPTVTGSTGDPATAAQPNSSGDASTVTVTGTSPAGDDLNPATAPATSAVTFNAPAGLYSPTRPGTPAAEAIESSAPVANVTPVATYVVVKGDSLSKVAGKYHLARSQLAKANGLKADASIRIGQKLIIPGRAAAGGPNAEAAPAAENATYDVTTYKVKAGDSLRLIARHNGTTVAALKSLNHLKGDTVRLGQQLKIPAGGAPASTAPAAEATTAPDTVTPEPVKGPGGRVTYTVKAGEKLSTIARKYGVTVGEIATANNIADPSKIRAGQQLVIPNGSTAGENTAKTAAPAETAPSTPTIGDVNGGSTTTPTDTEPPVIKVDDSSPVTPAPTSDTTPSTDASDTSKTP